MKNLLKVWCLILISGICVLAQTDNDDYKKNEFYVGYSNELATDFRRESASGVEVSYVRNVSRFFGVKGDFSGVYKKTTPTLFVRNTVLGDTTVDFDRRTQLYNFLGGVQIKDNASTARFKQFAHILGGAAVNRVSSKNFRCTSGNCAAVNFGESTSIDTSFSAALGGGLDIRINNKVDFQLIQVDYNPIFANIRQLIARASVIHAGKNQAVCRCDIFSVGEDNKEILCAAAQGTIVQVPGLENKNL